MIIRASRQADMSTARELLRQLGHDFMRKPLALEERS
jgi:hypothetical protein